MVTPKAILVVLFVGLTSCGNSDRETNERSAYASLKMLSTAQADYRSNDHDDNRIQDFWMGDVAGLYRNLRGRESLKLIEENLAQADAAPLPRASGRISFSTVSAWQPKRGYRFRVIPLDGQGKAYGEDLDGDGVRFECKDRCAFCAYPDRYDDDGMMTFILDESNSVWKKDTGGKAVDRWPANPAAQGWTKMP